MHTGVVGIWLMANCMGHHVWTKIKSKSLFTRTTDGQLLKYYTLYAVASLSVVAAMASCVHFLVELPLRQQRPLAALDGTTTALGWRCLLAFYTPVAILITANIYFYWTSQRKMSKQLIYNRSMQHFQVK